uniref:Glycosyltransferase n=1 Tax=Leersia perrieri TaxID=77586 RepID=A0A0D9WX41_9ORYZ
MASMVKAEAISSSSSPATTRSSRRRRVLMFPLPFQGHITPMLQLAGVLHAHGGLDVTVFHAPVNAPDPSRHPAAYRFVAVGDGNEFAAEAAALIPTGSYGDFPAALMALDALLRVPFEDALRRALAAEEDEDVAACLVVDSNFRGVQAVGERLGVPTLSLRTGGACCLAAYLAFPELCAKGILPPDQLQLDMPLTELPPLRLRDMVLSTTSSHATMATCLERILDSSRCSSGVILNTFNDLENSDLEKIATDLNVPVYAIGPLHKISIGLESSLLTQDRNCLEWLDKQETESVLYVSFGSLASMDREELLEIAWGLVDSQMSFLWVIRPNLAHGSQRVHLPDGFEEAIRGRGFELEGKLERETIERAVRRLMCKEEGKEMRRRAKALKNQARISVEKEGSSKTAIDMLVNLIMFCMDVGGEEEEES